MIRKHMISAMQVILLCLVSFSASAGDLVIVVNPENKQTLKIDDVARIYLGKKTYFPDGNKAIPLDLDPKDPLYEEFVAKVLKKSPRQLRAYWAKRIFTGKGRPPKSVSQQPDLRDVIASDKAFVGYLGQTHVDNTVRTVITVDGVH